MAEIAPDLSDRRRCVSVHWSIAAQCELPPTHWDDHETTHPETGARLKYCKVGGTWRTEEYRDGAWHRLEVPPPGGYCERPAPDRPGVTCTWQYGHPLSRAHVADVNGEWHQWPCLIPEPERRPGLSQEDLLCGLLYEQADELAQLRARLAEFEDGALPSGLRDELGNALVEAGGVPGKIPFEVRAQAGVLADAVLTVVRRAQAAHTSGKDTFALTGAVDSHPEPPAAADRLPRILKYIQRHGTASTASVHKACLSWGWKGLSLSQIRRDLVALTEAGHLAVDESNPNRRAYRPARAAQGGDAS